MGNFVSFNLCLIPAAESLVLAVSSAALYGKGIFSTLAIHNSNAFIWEKHWRRLTANAMIAGIDISPFSEEAILKAIDEIAAKNNVTNGRARITFFDESSVGPWPFETGRKSSLLMTTAENRKIAENFQLIVSPYRVNTTSPLLGIKSCNYLEHLMAFDEAKARGFDEAIRLNERGEVASACMANVFWSKAGKLYTPSLKTGCLAGTTREFIIENIDCKEVEAGTEAIREANEIFLTSAGIGVVQVAAFEGRAMQKEPHRILDIVPRAT